MKDGWRGTGDSRRAVDISRNRNIGIEGAAKAFQIMTMALIPTHSRLSLVQQSAGIGSGLLDVLSKRLRS